MLQARLKLDCYTVFSDENKMYQLWNKDIIFYISKKYVNMPHIQKVIGTSGKLLSLKKTIIA